MIEDFECQGILNEITQCLVRLGKFTSFKAQTQTASASINMRQTIRFQGPRDKVNRKSGIQIKTGFERSFEMHTVWYKHITYIIGHYNRTVRIIND